MVVELIIYYMEFQLGLEPGRVPYLSYVIGLGNASTRVEIWLSVNQNKKNAY